jgi:hypothetical protein
LAARHADEDEAYVLCIAAGWLRGVAAEEARTFLGNDGGRGDVLAEAP